MAGVLKIEQLAIICPVLNCLEYTKGFIKTIQTITPYYLIIIDNASTDRTGEYLSDIGNNWQIKIISNKRNEGVARSWNDGIRLAKNTYGCTKFFVVNNDILLKKCTIDRMVDLLNDPDIGLVTAYNVHGEIDSPEKLDTIFSPRRRKITEAPDFSCFMLNSETINQVGYFDENFWPAYFEDNDYHYRMKLAGLKAVKLNQALYYHFGSQTIKNSPDVEKISNEYYLQNKEYYIKKWGGVPGNEAYQTPFNVWEH